MKASKKNRNSSNAFQLMCSELARICWGHSTGCFIYCFVIQVISEKHCVAKVLLAIWEIVLQENNPNYNYYWFSNKFDFFPYFYLFYKLKTKIYSKLVVWQQEIFLFFVYRDSCSTSKPCRIQETVIKEFSYML